VTFLRDTEIVSNVHSNTTGKESRVPVSLGLDSRFGARRLSPHTVFHGHSSHSIVSYPVCGISRLMHNSNLCHSHSRETETVSSAQ
jgi:hypothetical protein